MKHCIRIVGALLLTVALVPAAARGEDSSTVLVRGATIWTQAADGRIEEADLLIRIAVNEAFQRRTQLTSADRGRGPGEATMSPSHGIRIKACVDGATAASECRLCAAGRSIS